MWPDWAKFRHLGYFFRLEAKFFFKKVAQENGYFLGYFLKWPEFFNFIAIKAFPSHKFLKFLKNFDQNDKFLENSATFWKLKIFFPVVILWILTLWECIWAPLEWPKSVNRGWKYLYLVKNALGEFLGYFLKKLGYFLTKLSGHTGDLCHLWQVAKKAI